MYYTAPHCAFETLGQCHPTNVVFSLFFVVLIVFACVLINKVHKY